jgi:hypothetical protein
MKQSLIEILARELFAGDFRNNHCTWDDAAPEIRDLFRIQAAKALHIAETR